MDGELVLLNPGPSGTSARVKNAMLRGDMCHREADFRELMVRVRAGLRRALNLDGHEAVLLAGSGTAAMEMAVVSSVRPGRALVVVTNGVYGDRMLAIGRTHGIRVYEVSPPGDGLAAWTTPIDPEAVRRELLDHDDVDAVVCVHHETTAGLMNPVAEIGAVVADVGALFVVDAISSTGIEDPDLATVRADIVCGTANKGLHGQPGTSFILCSEKALDRIRQVPARSLYLHAGTYLDAQQNGDVPFTPAVQIVYSLDEALQEYTESGGFEARTRLYRNRAAMVRAGFERIGLEMVVPEAFRSSSVTLLALPPRVTYERIHDELRHRGYVIYGGQGRLASRFFRICTMGEIPWGRLEYLEESLGTGLVAAIG